VAELVLAQGPAGYLAGSIETFALPMAAFIVIAAVLYLMFRRPHHVPGMKYLKSAYQTSAGTREPGAAGLITLASPADGPAVPGSADRGPTDGPAAPSSPTDGPAAPSAMDQGEGDS
jgi:hypothetical protein